MNANLTQQNTPGELELKNNEHGLAAMQVNTNTIGMKLKLIPAGEFLIGPRTTEQGRRDHERQHHVRIVKSRFCVFIRLLNLSG